MLWEDRFVNDEIWLRVRRVLIGCLEAAGLSFDAAALSEGLTELHALGEAELAAAARRLGGDWASALRSETMLGAAGRRFQLRLPFILAFGAGYADALLALEPVPSARRPEVRTLAALFNLGIVLVDAVMDDPERFGCFEAFFGTGDLDARLRGSAPPADPPGADTSPEMAVLALLIDGFFAGLRAVDPDPDPALAGKIRETLTAAYAGQLRTAGSAPSERDIRDKSVAPFLVAPLLLGLARGGPPPERLLAIGRHVGEAFWRIDDLVDVSRDCHFGQPNVLAMRAGIARPTMPGSRPGIAALLEGDAIERIAKEAVSHLELALTRAGEWPEAVAPLRRWLGLYALDWLR